ncbi:hypothetical protein XBFFL1_1290027 [Xenorhabdus bovienii str. feltiae Florida]|uniref:Uncharacterized protein n=2 Tax=Xenorhabdus bovienii TaxID=40576 RepID=A0A077P5W9_XENBV|nr:hypothetical protein XBFFL1_1290027 [Xenorhabdus bovienii str. feltiae Florida]CDH00220.1 hypothetical protein XBFM1_1440018 [Xenorhabdus bovienii str. feltiae Moldova]CDH06013.1 hypothetical protein XBO1_2110016 [Xenorhabdus bovienii str. oregonense]
MGRLLFYLNTQLSLHIVVIELIVTESKLSAEIKSAQSRKCNNEAM